MSLALSSTLTGISIFCLANRNSPWFTRIFGGAAGNEGLGAFALCLDWNYVGSGGGSMGALFTPLSTQLSLYCGTALCMLVLLLLSPTVLALTDAMRRLGSHSAPASP